MSHWAYDAIFYHIYPLGFCGAPHTNDFHSTPIPRLDQVGAWIDHLRWLGANALYLGPVFESRTHGYDSVDYFTVDRRLGTNETLSALSRRLHQNGLRLVLDGVFNHVGRDFWAFRDLQANLQASPYKDWFYNLSFEHPSPLGDPFSYETWNGHYELVKLNLTNPGVRRHLFEAVRHWIESFDLDGLRLDAADCMDLDFLQELAAVCRRLRPHFWLMGEVVHGDYRRWVNPGCLDSVTNYECYKGLYSSHLDRNYFEIAYSLNRQFGPEGLYRDLPLYSFADNHDVSRVASSLEEKTHLFPLYCLLFTMPGVPSLYYGSEWGIEAGKSNGSDWHLRPRIDRAWIEANPPRPGLAEVVSRLAAIHHRTLALRYGDYNQLHVAHQQLVFSRAVASQSVVVMVNAADRPASLDVAAPSAAARWVDLLEPSQAFAAASGRLRVAEVPPYWARILVDRPD